MTAATAPDAAPALGVGSRSYRAYVLGALLVVYTFNFIDRTLVGVLNEPIKDALNAAIPAGQPRVSDFMMGLLGGPAFALLYTFMGLPIARLAERFNRVIIVASALAIWSVMTALCGLAGRLDLVLHATIYLAVLAPVAIAFMWMRMWVSLALVLVAGVASVAVAPILAGLGFLTYGLLLMSRIGVGIGEAGCSPPSHSLISDYFPPERRASALSVYALGIPIGASLSALGGGWFVENVDWRAAFLWLGLPGVLIALITFATVREPGRGAHEQAPDFSSVLQTLATKWTFWHVALGGAITSFVGYGAGQFLNSYLIRSHGLNAFQASLIFGIFVGIGPGIGTFLGGFLSDRMSRFWKNALVLVPGLGLILSAPLYLLGLFAPSLPVLLAVFVPAAILHYFYLGPMFGITQGLVEPRMRATASALLLFIVNLIGFALGPPAVGALSDLLASLVYTGASHNADCVLAAVATPACQAAEARGLEYALMIAVLGYAWGGLHFLLARKNLQRDTVS